MTDRRVALLFVDRLACARLTEALRGFAEPWIVPDAATIVQAIRADAAPCATVVFFSPEHQAEALRAADVLRAEYPEHAIIGYADPRSLSSQFILDTGRAELSDLVLRDVDDSRTVLLRVVQNAEQRSVAVRVAEHMCRGASRNVRITVQFVCQRLREPLDVPTVAAGLGVSRRTLHHRLGQTGSPTASELIGWCRVLYTAYQLSNSRRSLADIAAQLDEPSWRNLNYLLRRYLGSGANQLRHPDAFAQSLEKYHDAFAKRPPQPMVCWAERATTPTLV